MNQKYVIINIGTSEIYYPSFIPPRLLHGKKYPYNRMGDVVGLMKEAAEKNVVCLNDYHKGMFKDGEMFRLSHSTEYIFSVHSGNIYVYRICEIQKNRPWTIVSNEYGEHIRCFSLKDNYKIIDEEIAYAEKLD